MNAHTLHVHTVAAVAAAAAAVRLSPAPICMAMLYYVAARCHAGVADNVADNKFI